MQVLGWSLQSTRTVGNQSVWGSIFFVDLLLILTHPQNGLILIAFFLLLWEIQCVTRITTILRVISLFFKKKAIKGECFTTVAKGGGG